MKQVRLIRQPESAESSDGTSVAATGSGEVAAVIEQSRADKHQLGLLDDIEVEDAGYTRCKGEMQIHASTNIIEWNACTQQ